DMVPAGRQYGTALRAALYAQHLDIVILLLGKGGADPNAPDGEYKTALQAASYIGHLEIVPLLLDKGADPNAQG
ncbi:ankyrin repeat-containing domain protein, partial [Mycena olivaceomarginata]